MEKFRTIRDGFVSMPDANIDTDQILPARYLKLPRSKDYGNFLFRDLRFHADGTPRSDSPVGEGSPTILVAGPNFGSGSSREGAVYALYEFGFRCIIARSFGDIFFNNCLKNGLLPVRLPADAVDEIRANPSTGLTVDLELGTVAQGDRVYGFQVPAFARQCLLLGLSDVDVTLNEKRLIREFAERHFRSHPYILPPDKL